MIFQFWNLFWTMFFSFCECISDFDDQKVDFLLLVRKFSFCECMSHFADLDSKNNVFLAQSG